MIEVNIGFNERNGVHMVRVNFEADVGSSAEREVGAEAVDIAAECSEGVVGFVENGVAIGEVVGTSLGRIVDSSLS